MRKNMSIVIAIVTILLLVSCPTPNDPDQTRPVPVTYAVTVNSSGETLNELVTAHVSRAEQGSEVILTADLGSGRQVALSAPGVTISLVTICIDGGTATFTMPAEAVEVSAFFSNMPSPGSNESHTATNITFDMHFVPAGGVFTMGEHAISQTQTVLLQRSFWMGKVEVTQSLWEDVWGPAWPETDPEGSGRGEGENYPAYFVNWFDAVTFCNLLTLADNSIMDTEQVYFSDEGLTIAYTKTDAANENDVYVNWSNIGYRLPTEAEWEYAARYIDGESWNNGDHVSGDTQYACYEEEAGGGSQSGSPLASDERISEYAWWEANKNPNGSKEVAQKNDNALGLYDMCGNVSEWCYDWWGMYSGGSETDPVGPGNGFSRIMRGGMWADSGRYLQCAMQLTTSDSSRSYTIGIRLCRTAN